jgi:hypothetical protein
MEISLEPYKKLTFRTYFEYNTPQDLARSLAMQIPVGIPASTTLRWSNGVLFAVANYQPTDSITKENIAGHVLYDHIDFAVMQEYQNEIKLPEREMVVLNILNLSEHPLFGELGHWIKQNLAKKRGAQLSTARATTKKSG